MKILTFAAFVLSITSPYAYADLTLKGQMDNVLPSFGTGVNGNAVTPDGVLNVDKHSFITPGDILFSAKRRCGDGDVVRFSQQDKNFNFYKKTNPRVAQVFGYWLSTGDTAKETTPTVETWMPIFYGDININSGFTLDPHSKNGSIPLRADNSNVVITAVAKSRLGILFKHLNDAYLIKDSNKSATKYRLHMGSMMCATFFGDEVESKNGKYGITKTDRVTSYDLSLSFANGMPYKINSYLDSIDFKTENDITNNLSNFSLSIKPNAFVSPKSTSASNSTGPLEINFSTKAKFNLTNNILVKAASKVLDTYEWNALTYPAKVGTPEFAVDLNLSKLNALKEYKQLFKNDSLYSSLKSLRDQINAKNTECSDLSLGGSKLAINTKLWYYPTVMNLECKELTKDYVTLFDAFFNISNYDQLPQSQTEFETRRAAFVKKLLSAGILKEAQTVAAHEYKNKENLRCFKNNGDKYVDTVLNASMIKMTLDENNFLVLKSPDVSVHPEYLYAIMPMIRDLYANNNYILFGDRNPNTDIHFSLSNIPNFDPIKSFSQPIELKMQVRTLPSGIEIIDTAPYYFNDIDKCEMFCNQETPKEKNKDEIYSFNTIR